MRFSKATGAARDEANSCPSNSLGIASLVPASNVEPFGIVISLLVPNGIVPACNPSPSGCRFFESLRTLFGIPSCG